MLATSNLAIEWLRTLGQYHRAHYKMPGCKNVRSWQERQTCGWWHRWADRNLCCWADWRWLYRQILEQWKLKAWSLQRGRLFLRFLPSWRKLGAQTNPGCCSSSSWQWQTGKTSCIDQKQRRQLLRWWRSLSQVWISMKLYFCKVFTLQFSLLTL